jgi:hypothetical protein
VSKGVWQVGKKTDAKMIDRLATKRNALNKGILLTSFFCAACALASGALRVTNEEYRFSVEFPESARVCEATSGSHPHGFYARLNSKDCHSSEPNISVISVNAYNNATFEVSPEQEIDGLCRKEKAGHDSDAFKDITFAGRHSANCRREREDGSIDIYVVTQAGRWPGKHESQEFESPFVNYMASLHTTQAFISGDLTKFRRVLSSIRIEYAD